MHLVNTRTVHKKIKRLMIVSEVYDVKNYEKGFRKNTFVKLITHGKHMYNNSNSTKDVLYGVPWQLALRMVCTC